MKKKFSHTNLSFFILFAISGLTACSSLTQPAQHSQRSQGEAGELSAPAGVVMPAQLDALRYYNWVLAAATEQLQSEQQRLEQAVSARTGGHSLIQLAVLISARSSDTAQQQRALALLNQHEQSQSASVSEDYHALAHLWRQALEPRLLSHELQQKIDALTSIEQQLGNRQQQGD